MATREYSDNGKAPAPVERRQCQRFKAPDLTLAITPSIIGQIVDISTGGCEVKYIDTAGRLEQRASMDILLNEKEFYMERVPIAVAWEESQENGALSAISVKKVGICFAELSPVQKERIDYFIKNFTLGMT